MANAPPDDRVITACIDGSANTAAVCDAAAWAGRSIGASIRFLHVIEPDNPPTSGASERLLEDTRACGHAGSAGRRCAAASRQVC